MTHFSSLIGQSPVIDSLIRNARIIATTDVTVLLKGETGAGKEILAQAIQKGSIRANKAFITLNCAADGGTLFLDEINRIPESTKIPFLSDLPVEFRRTVPVININVFVYSEHGEESFVMIDMVKYKAGLQLKNGMMLKAILNDSLLMSYQNHEFQIERP